MREALAAEEHGDGEPDEDAASEREDDPSEDATSDEGGEPREDE